MRKYGLKNKPCINGGKFQLSDWQERGSAAERGDPVLGVPLRRAQPPHSLHRTVGVGQYASRHVRPAGRALQA